MSEFVRSGCATMIGTPLRSEVRREGRMAQLKLDVDAETYQRLVEDAVAERRPIDWQAEVTLRRALGLPFPEPAICRPLIDPAREPDPKTAA
jgi:hypothetical protein